jgi:hypothetical protein
VDRSGQVVYSDRKDDDLPLKMTLLDAQTNEIFALAEKLDWFQRPLESDLKVAFMGTKTLRAEGGKKPTETKFNYSQDLDAQKLVDWFERVNESGQNYFFLERTVKYDPLGVNKAILQLQTSLERQRLLAKEAFLPLLDRVAKSKTYMNMSRERAANLAELFRNPPPPTQPEPGATAATAATPVPAAAITQAEPAKLEPVKPAPTIPKPVAGKPKPTKPAASPSESPK